MPYASFLVRFPAVGKCETRTVSVGPGPYLGLPPGDYTFLELYCDEPRCDCRRVFFAVMSPGRDEPLATIAYGWESRDYYVRWMGDDEPLVTDELKGPALPLNSIQSPLAPALLKLFATTLLKDTEYVERIKRHYRMYRKAVDKSDPVPP